MSDNCYLCKGRFFDFPNDYDYVEFLNGIGRKDVHQSCLKKTHLQYLTLSEAQDKEIEILTQN